MRTKRRPFSTSVTKQIVARAVDPPHHDYWIGDMVRPRRTKSLNWLIETFHRHTGDSCIEWPFSARSNGYGQIFIGGTRTTVSRVVCVWQHGPPPQSGLQAAHACGNRKCCNPRHIRWATAAENTQDKFRHGTVVHGESHYMGKLTERDVQNIRLRRRGGETLSEIARDYDLAFQTVSEIAHRKIWRHVA